MADNLVLLGGAGEGAVVDTLLDALVSDELLDEVLGALLGPPSPAPALMGGGAVEVELPRIVGHLRVGVLYPWPRAVRAVSFVQVPHVEGAMDGMWRDGEVAHVGVAHDFDDTLATREEWESAFEPWVR